MSPLTALCCAVLLSQAPDAGDAQTSADDAGTVLPAANDGVEPGFTVMPARQVPVLEIFGADGGVVFSKPVTGEAEVIALAPGNYRLRLGAGPVHGFSLREDDEPRIEATNLTLRGVWPEGADIPLTVARPTLRTVKSTKLIEVTLGIGQAFFSNATRDFAGVAGVLVGVTDHLQWNAPFPYFSYLIGEPQELEWVIEGGANGIGATAVSFFTGLSASVARRKYWNPERSWTVGAEVTGNLAFGPQPLRSFAYVTGRVEAAYSITIDRRWSFNPGVALNGAARPFGQGFLISAAREPLPGRPSLALGSVMRLAGRDYPLVQWHFNRRLSFDFHSTIAVGYQRVVAPLRDAVDTFPVYGDVILGFTYVGG